MNTKSLSLFFVPLLSFFVLSLSGCNGQLAQLKEEHPVGYALGTGLAKGLLYSQVDQLTDNATEQAALRTVITAAFEATEAVDVALALNHGLSSVYADDPDALEIVQLTFHDVLTDPPASQAPASGPERAFCHDLAQALGKFPVASALAPASAASSETAHSYQLGTHYATPAWAQIEWGSHWSDPLWSATAFFSGVDSYAGLRAWHSRPAETDYQAQLNESQLAHYEARTGQIHRRR